MLKTIQNQAIPLLEQLQPKVQKQYVLLMMDIIARGLVSASKTDKEIQQEIKGFKIGQTIQMLVMPNVAKFTLQVTDDFKLRILSDSEMQGEKADLIIKFKHVSLAFLVFTFQESTTAAFARDRMIVDGDISDAPRMVRCLNRLEVLILPKLIAQLAVKEYPKNLSLKEKITLGAKVYAGVGKTFLQR